jgi:undecaprenyl pyrophosphate phosphatase UppP
MDEARERIREEDEQNKEGVRLARRLLIAFILIVILGVVFYVVLPEYGLKLDPMVPVLSFLAILIGAVMTAVEENRDSDDSDDDEDYSCGSSGCGGDGCAVGMCPGPRPLRIFSKPKKK